MTNKEIREMKEMKSLFADPKFFRAAWKSVGQAILQNPASRPVSYTDKDGNLTLAAEIESYSYNKLKQDLKSITDEKDREPTELEMIMQCQIIRARYDTNAAIFVRDTLGAKPVDESKVDAQINNPYENMTDDELEALAKYREERDKAAVPEPSGTSPLVEGGHDD